MDTPTISREVQSLQSNAQQVTQAITILAGRMQAAADAGNNSASTWLADLRAIALAVQGEQAQIFRVLNEVQRFVAVQSEPSMGSWLGTALRSPLAGAFENGIGFGLGTDMVRRILP
jgi:hypothetical protein